MVFAGGVLAVLVTIGLVGVVVGQQGPPPAPSSATPLEMTPLKAATPPTTARVQQQPARLESTPVVPPPGTTLTPTSLTLPPTVRLPASNPAPVPSAPSKAEPPASSPGPAAEPAPSAAVSALEMNEASTSRQEPTVFLEWVSPPMARLGQA